MDRQYLEYYRNQAGTGLPAYEGLQYQRGHGFFGDAFKTLFNRILRPAGDYILPKIVKTGKRIGSDIMSGQNVLDSLSRNITQTAEEMFDDGVTRARKFIQTGKGRKRRKTRRGRPKKSAINGKPNKKKTSLKRKPKKAKVVKKESKRKTKKQPRTKKSTNKFLDLLR